MDEFDVKAEEVIPRIPDGFHYARDALTSACAAALRAARNQGLEDAAKVCDIVAKRYRHPGDESFDPAAKHCAGAIRRLKTPGVPTDLPVQEMPEVPNA